MKSIATVRYISGREEKFEIELWGGTGAESRFKKFVEEPTVVLQTATELIIIPSTAIESISIALPKDADQQPNVGTIRKGKRIK